MLPRLASTVSVGCCKVADPMTLTVVTVSISVLVLVILLLVAVRGTMLLPVLRGPWLGPPSSATNRTRMVER